MYYKLVDTIPVSCDSAEEAFGGDRSILKTKIWDAEVSTVFLGIEHWRDHVGKPILFETMIFWGKEDGYQDRYVSYKEAIEWHMEAVNLINNQK